MFQIVNWARRSPSVAENFVNPLAIELENLGILEIEEWDADGKTRPLYVTLTWA